MKPGRTTVSLRSNFGWIVSTGKARGKLSSHYETPGFGRLEMSCEWRTSKLRRAIIANFEDRYLAGLRLCLNERLPSLQALCLGKQLQAQQIQMHINAPLCLEIFPVFMS
jgi:hypothetical protein